jgi:hypothetical protein
MKRGKKERSHSPAGFFANISLGRFEKVEELRQNTTIDDHLRLGIIASDDVSNRAKSGSDHIVQRM